MLIGNPVIRLHPKQAEVFKTRSRFKVVVAGRRWGKTQLAKASIISRATIPRSKIWYVAPSYRMAKMIMWQELKESIPSAWIAKIHETDLTITLKNKTVIECKGADKPDTLRGVGLHYLVLDEFQDFKVDTWTKVLRPTLASTQGDALFIGTPKGYANLYEVYINGVPGAKKKRSWMSWQFPTITSPFIPEAEIAAAREDMDPKSFQQEFEACHLPETEIRLANGKIKQIQHIQKGDLIPYIRPDGERDLCQALQVGVTGVKPIVQVTLETGEVVTASNHHKFKVHIDESNQSIS